MLVVTRGRMETDMRNVILVVALLILLPTPAGAQAAPLDPSRDPRYNPSINPNLNPSINPTFNPSLNPKYNPSLNPRYDPTAPAQPVFTPEGKPMLTPGGKPMSTNEKPTDVYGVPDGQGGTNYFDSNGRWKGFSPKP